jgi:translation elongation factor P/translation initiation factor 5A
LGLLSKASVAIDGSKFKAVNNRDKNFTQAKVEKRRTQLEESVARYLAQLDTADRQEPSESIELKKTHLKEKLEKLKSDAEAGGDRATGACLARQADLADRSR